MNQFLDCFEVLCQRRNETQISSWSGRDAAELASARGGSSPGLAALAGSGVPPIPPSAYRQIHPAPSNALASQQPCSLVIARILNLCLQEVLRGKLLQNI